MLLYLSISQKKIHRIYLYIIYVGIVAAIRHLGYERVYLLLCEVSNTPFHIQGDLFITMMGQHRYKTFGQSVVFAGCAHENDNE